MQNIHLSKTLRVSLFAMIAILIGLSCSEKIVNNNDPGGNVVIELRATPRSTALASVVNQVVLSVWADDMDMVVDTLPYDGMPLAFVLDVPAGVNRHFHVEAYKSYTTTDTSGTTIDSMTLIYEGSTVTDIGGGGPTAVQINMMAVVPIIRVFPHGAAIPSGAPIELKVEAFNMPGLQDAHFWIDETSLQFDFDSMAPGSSVDTPGDYFSYGDGTYTTIQGDQPLGDAEGYSHLVTLYYSTRFFAGFDDTATISLVPTDISDPTLFDPIYYESANITVLGLPDTLVSFPDQELTQVISWASETPGALNLSDVLRITSLSAVERGISDLTNIGALMNLNSLYFNAELISDLSPLSGMTRLSTIDLGLNQINDLSGLRNLPSLYSLELPWNQITDLTPLLTNNLLSPGDYVDVSYNPLDDNSINVVIPTLRELGITVEYMSGD